MFIELKNKVKPPFVAGPKNALTLELEERAAGVLCAPVGRPERDRPNPQNPRRRGGLLQESVPRAPSTRTRLLQNVRQSRRRAVRPQNRYARADSLQRGWSSLTPGQFDLSAVRIYADQFRWPPSPTDLVVPEKSGRPLLFQKALAAASTTDALGSACFDEKGGSYQKAQPYAEVESPGAPVDGEMVGKDSRQRRLQAEAHRIPTAVYARRLGCGGIRGSNVQVETGFRPRSTPRPGRVIPYEDLLFCSFCRARNFPARL